MFPGVHFPALFPLAAWPPTLFTMAQFRGHGRTPDASGPLMSVPKNKVWASGDRAGRAAAGHCRAPGGQATSLLCVGLGQPPPFQLHGPSGHRQLSAGSGPGRRREKSLHRPQTAQGLCGDVGGGVHAPVWPCWKCCAGGWPRNPGAGVVCAFSPFPNSGPQEVRVPPSTSVQRKV